MSYSQSETMSPVTFDAIRIVGLPVEMQTTYDVSGFLTDSIGFEPTHVNIVSLKTDAGVPYRTAFIDIDSTKIPTGFLKERFLSEGIYIHGDSVALDFHYDNGKPMNYIKIVATKRNSPSKAPLHLEDGTWSSLYIPFVPEDLTGDNGDVRYMGQDGFAELFEDHLAIGQIDRVDFISKTIPGSDRRVKCAYVHFSHWYDNPTSAHIRNVIQDKGEFMCNGFYDGFEFRRFDNRRFITFKVNHKPIPAVSLTEQEELNIHQLVASKANLEARVAELEAEVASLKTVTLPGTDGLPCVQLDENHRNLIADNIKLKAEKDNLEDECDSLREHLDMFQANRADKRKC